MKLVNEELPVETWKSLMTGVPEEADQGKDATVDREGRTLTLEFASG